ncbi:MAG TPA: hypothetical protein VIC85_21865 [Ktedonobacterales bacterium]|jgi:hypothetical protein
MEWGSLVPLVLVVIFWMIIFVIAVSLTRRFLHGVGEPVADDEEGPLPNGAGPANGSHAATSGTMTAPAP